MAELSQVMASFHCSRQVFCKALGRRSEQLLANILGKVGSGQWILQQHLQTRLGVLKQGMTGAAHWQRVVLTKGLYRIAGVVFDLVQVGHQQIYFPALQTRGQFCQGASTTSKCTPGCARSKMASTGATSARAGKRTYSHTQLTLLQAARQLQVTLQVLGVQQQLPGMLQ